MAIFYETLASTKEKLAQLTAMLGELILAEQGSSLVLVSLARAGTPIGILVRRWLKYRHKLEVPHYSISIIRDKGIDENALQFILSRHAGQPIQFLDGWTGKGVIQDTLIDACKKFASKYGVHLDPRLAVLSDPAWCTQLYATREDFLIPSACLNSTVSGLMSRTVLNPALIGPEDFHGAKFYQELAESDVSNLFVDTVTGEFDKVVLEPLSLPPPVTSPYKGLVDIRGIQQHFGIPDINLVKPGVGETTRVLLRRVPWRILVDSMDNHNLRHILRLAEERKVPVTVCRDMSYSCCGIIKPKEFGDL